MAEFSEIGLKILADKHKAIFVKKKPRKFLIINSFGIGDVLFSTPLIRNIKEGLPDSKIFYLCNRRALGALENHPLLSKCFVYERDEFEAIRKKSTIAWFKKVLNLLSDIKKEKIDIVFDLSLNSQFGFLCWISGIKERIGYNYKNRGRFLTKKINFKGYNCKHVVEYYLDLLKFIGIEAKHRKIEIFLKEEPKKAEQSIVIVPGGGASWGKDSFLKHWPKEKFAQLADRIIDNLGVKVVLSGSSREKDIIDRVVALMHNVPIQAVGWELDEFLNLLSQAKLLITNDGGPIHMAVGLGVKTVSFFGPVSEIVYGPYSKDRNQHIVVKKQFPCRPCYKKFRLSECTYNKRCLEQITVDEVFEAAKALI